MSSTDERVDFRGQSWFVADARFDESPLESSLRTKTGHIGFIARRALSGEKK